MPRPKFFARCHHPRTTANTILGNKRLDGTRPEGCRICKKASQQAWREKNRLNHSRSSTARGNPGEARHSAASSPAVAPQSPVEPPTPAPAVLTYRQEREAAKRRLEAKMAPVWDAAKRMWAEMLSEAERAGKGGRPRARPLLIEGRHHG